MREPTQLKYLFKFECQKCGLTYVCNANSLSEGICTNHKCDNKNAIVTILKEKK